MFPRDFAYRLTFAAVTAACLLAPTGAALADDIAPPPWPRLGAANFSTAAEWEFFAPITFPDTTKIADGVEVPLVVGDGTGGMPPDMLPDFDIGWVVGDGDGGYLGGINGIGDGTLNFRVGNWVDTEPLKELRVQITFTPNAAGDSPYVDQIIPFDPLGIDSVAQTGVFDGPLVGDPAGRHHRLETWQILPNPDFESILVVVPDGVLVDQVVIDTISFPEPTSLALLTLAGLMLVRRR